MNGGIHMHTQFWQMHLVVSLLVVLSGLLGLPRHSPAHVVEFMCAAGDVACLIEAITQANANGEANTIILEVGTYTLTAVNNDTDGLNGLPSVTGVVTIQGAGADATIIERAASTPAFRPVHVAATGTLTLKGLTLRQGTVLYGGGVIFNAGTLTLTDCTLTNNRGGDVGGGLVNTGGLVTIARSTITKNASSHPGGGLFVFGGAVTIRQSTLADNGADPGGALANGGGTVVITDSAIVNNQSLTDGGGLSNSVSIAPPGSVSVLVVTNTTIARNRVLGGGGFGAVGVTSFGGTVILTNATVTGNTSLGGAFGGVGRSDSVLALQNTLVALNTGTRGSECGGVVTSLGHNLLGDPTGCTITLLSTDLTGDPGLGDFTDDGTPGNGHFPLLAGSPAINAGNDAMCPRTDQLGQRRVGPCDIGAIEFRGKRHKHYRYDAQRWK
jgi:hypothetical protein